jgi:predicted MFS family arabinose efflux permease
MAAAGQLLELKRTAGALVRRNHKAMSTYLNTLRLFSRDVRLLLTCGGIFGFAYFGIYSLLLNLYLLRLGYDIAFIGLVNAIGPLMMVIVGLPSGALSQRWGSRRVLMVSFALMALGFGLLPLAEFIPAGGRAGWLLATYMLGWIGVTPFPVNIGPFLMVATGEQERSHAFAANAAVISIAGFAGSLAGGLLPGLFAGFLDLSLAEPAAYRFALWSAAVLFLPAVLAMGATRVAGGRQPQQVLAETEAAPYLLIFMLALFLFLRMAGHWIMRIFFNVYLDTELHASTALIGGLAALSQLLGVVALVAPPVIARWGKARTIGWGALGSAGTFLPLILIPHWVGVAVGLMSMGVLNSLLGPAFDFFSQELVLPAWRTILSGALITALGVSIAAVAYGGGYVISAWGYPMLFAAGSGFSLAAALLFFTYFRRPRGRLAHQPVAKGMEIAGAATSAKAGAASE